MNEMNDNRIAIGVDPGKDGSMAIITPYGPHLMTFDEECYRDQLSALYVSYAKPEERPHAFCVVEHVGAMPGQGVTSCFSFGRNFGFILGLLTAFRIPYELVRPQKWKKEFGCTSDKNTSIEVARRLFPGVSLKRTERCTKDHDGLAEALLLAEYAKRRMV